MHSTTIEHSTGCRSPSSGGGGGGGGRATSAPIGFAIRCAATCAGERPGAAFEFVPDAGFSAGPAENPRPGGRCCARLGSPRSPSRRRAREWRAQIAPFDTQGARSAGAAHTDQLSIASGPSVALSIISTEDEDAPRAIDVALADAVCLAPDVLLVPELVELVVRGGARASVPLHADRRGGRTALHLAALRQHADAVAVLAGLDASAIDAQDEDGSTALHIAAGHGDARSVYALLAAGARRYRRDRWGRTALECVRPGAREVIVDMLCSHGGRVALRAKALALPSEGAAPRRVCDASTQAGSLDAAESPPLSSPPRRGRGAHYSHGGRAPPSCLSSRLSALGGGSPSIVTETSPLSTPPERRAARLSPSPGSDAAGMRDTPGGPSTPAERAVDSEMAAMMAMSPCQDVEAAVAALRERASDVLSEAEAQHRGGGRVRSLDQVLHVVREQEAMLRALLKDAQTMRAKRRQREGALHAQYSARVQELEGRLEEALSSGGAAGAAAQGEAQQREAGSLRAQYAARVHELQAQLDDAAASAADANARADGWPDASARADDWAGDDRQEAARARVQDAADELRREYEAKLAQLRARVAEGELELASARAAESDARMRLALQPQPQPERWPTEPPSPREPGASQDGRRRAHASAGARGKHAPPPEASTEPSDASDGVAEETQLCTVGASSALGGGGGANGGALAPLGNTPRALVMTVVAMLHAHREQQAALNRQLREREAGVHRRLFEMVEWQARAIRRMRHSVTVLARELDALESSHPGAETLPGTPAVGSSDDGSSAAGGGGAPYDSGTAAEVELNRRRLLLELRRQDLDEREEVVKTSERQIHEQRALVSSLLASLATRPELAEFLRSADAAAAAEHFGSDFDR